MNKTKLFLIIVMVIFLDGCAMIPKYAQPQLPVPAGFPRAEAYLDDLYAQGTRPVTDLRWQDVFRDKKLQKVIEISLENNRDLRLAILNVERARALYGVAQAELLPVVTGSGNGSDQLIPARLSSTGVPLKAQQYSVDLGITGWEIDLFGRIRSLKAQALEEYLASEQARRGAQTALISAVARAYFTLAADIENLKLARSTLEAQRGVYGVIWQQYDKGIATEADLRRSQTQVDTANRDVAFYTQSLAQDRNALDLLAGSTVPEYLLPFDLTNVIPPRDISPGLSSEVLLRRPDIMESEHHLKAAYAFIGAARAAFFPRLSLTTALGTTTNEFSNLFGPGSKAWSIAGQTAVSIFDTRTLAAYRVSKTSFKIFVTQYEKAIQTAFREVADALAARGMVDQQLAAQESIVNSAQKIYELSDQRYLQGIDGYISVLDAQRSLYSAQQAVTSLRLAKLVNQVRLYAVLGGVGLDETDELRQASRGSFQEKALSSLDPQSINY
jgi:outer membrane protein, multidrug efflux system